MKRKMRNIFNIFVRFHRDEGGQTLVFVVVLFFFLLLVASTSVDFYLYLPRKIRAQQSADAAALMVSHWQAKAALILGATNFIRPIPIALCAIPYTRPLAIAINGILNAIVMAVRQAFPVLGLINAQNAAKQNGGSSLYRMLDEMPDEGIWATMRILAEIPGMEYVAGEIYALTLGKVSPDGTTFSNYMPPTGTMVTAAGDCNTQIVLYGELWREPPPTIAITWVSASEGMVLAYFDKKLPVSLAFAQSQVGDDEKSGPIYDVQMTIKLSEIDFNNANLFNMNVILSWLNSFTEH